MGYAIVDSGCPRTVCGKVWMDSYLDSMSCKDRVVSKPSYHRFHFADGSVHKSVDNLIIPVYINNEQVPLTVDVIDCNIPLLLSRSTLKRANATIDFENDSLYFLDHVVPLTTTTSGHYCVRVSRDFSTTNSETQRVLFASPIARGNSSENAEKIKKLHKQFCHPSADKLYKLIKDSGVEDSDIRKLIKMITENCSTCKKFRKTPSRPIVGFPTASMFNQMVAVDLKAIDHNLYILHMVDHATRYSAACLIRNKRKETIVKGLMEYWCRIFGFPTFLLSDNGGEFVNSDIVNFAETFNITLKTTAAESPWSNGLCEKHNGILGTMLNKTRSELPDCPVEIILHWVVAAKNAHHQCMVTALILLLGAIFVFQQL